MDNINSATAPVTPVSAQVILEDVRKALAEDIGSGDVSADLVAASTQGEAEVICREPGVLAGAGWFEACFRELDASVRLEWHVADGARLHADQRLVTIRGPARALLGAERSALNFLQTLSGTATTTAEWVARLSGSRTRVLDTRKTLPGLRQAQKYAVRVGGGTNHRMGLFDAVLIKENHILACGSIERAVQRARELHPGLMVEVEVEGFDELDQALAAGADRVMLDEFPAQRLREAVALIGSRCESEISGGLTAHALPQILDSGVDFISVGALTKHLRALDLSMRMLRTWHSD